MPFHDSVQSVADALDACRLILEHATGQTLESYRSNLMCRCTIERQFEILGEALNRVAKADASFRGRFPEIGDIIGMRNCITHRYDAVNDDIVLRAAHDDVPPLMEKLETWLEANG